MARAEKQKRTRGYDSLRILAAANLYTVSQTPATACTTANNAKDVNCNAHLSLCAHVHYTTRSHKLCNQKNGCSWWREGFGPSRMARGKRTARSQHKRPLSLKQIEGARIVDGTGLLWMFVCPCVFHLREGGYIRSGLFASAPHGPRWHIDSAGLSTVCDGIE